MSQENVEAYQRGVDAWNRRDIDALVKVLDPAVEFHTALQVMFGGESTVYRGHEGVRELFRDVAAAFAEFKIEISDIWDVGERMVATGHLRGRGKESGAEVASPIGYVVEFKDGKAIRLDDYFDPNEALEAVGLRE